MRKASSLAVAAAVVCCSVLLGCSERATVRAEARGGTIPRDEVLDIASRAAVAEGYDLEKFAAPKVTFDPEAEQWWLFFEGIVEPRPGNYFHVVVEGKTGKASVRHGE